MKVRLSPRAARDSAELADDSARADASGAGALASAIRTTFRLVARHLRLGRLQTDGVTRKRVVPRFKNLIYDTLEFDMTTVAVVTIRHPARVREMQDG